MSIENAQKFFSKKKKGTGQEGGPIPGKRSKPIREMLYAARLKSTTRSFPGIQQSKSKPSRTGLSFGRRMSGLQPHNGGELIVTEDRGGIAAGVFDTVPKADVVFRSGSVKKLFLVFQAAPEKKFREDKHDEKRNGKGSDEEPGEFHSPDFPCKSSAGQQGQSDQTEPNIDRMAENPPDVFLVHFFTGPVGFLVYHKTASRSETLIFKRVYLF